MTLNNKTDTTTVSIGILFPRTTHSLAEARTSSYINVSLHKWMYVCDVGKPSAYQEHDWKQLGISRCPPRVSLERANIPSSFGNQ